MEARRTTRSRPSSLASSSGLTVIELLIALAVAAIVLGTALALTLSSKNLFSVDRARVETNQSIRGILDIMGNDVRIAGERLNTFGSSGTLTAHSLAAVEVVGGTDLYLRRNLLNEVLPLCGPLDSSITSIPITSLDSATYGFQPLCNPTDPAVDGNGDGVPDALVAWRTYRAENGPEVGAYVYTRAGGGKSDLFIYAGPDSSASAIVRAGGTLDNAYTVENQAVILLVEERHYYLNGDVLELVINGDTDNPLRLVNGVTDFKVQVVAADGTQYADYVASGADWASMGGVEIAITGTVRERNRDIERTLSSRYFPRNVLSN